MSAQDQELLCIRPMALEDVDTISRWFEHLADLSIFDRATPVPTNNTVVSDSWKDVLAASEPRSNYWFGIDNAVGEIIGICGIENINYVNGDATLAMYMADEGRRKGVARLASGVLLDLAFDQLRLNRVTSCYRQDNEATDKLTGTIGFSREGIKRQAWFAGGQYFDAIAIGILASEWPDARKVLIANLGEITKIKFGRPPWQARVWPQKLT